jgi:4-hydroxythreonine-4-phosphate dehydrogenase
LKSTIRVTLEALRNDWRIRRPRIAILGLNPHAGENGDIGREELEIIRPVIRSFKSSKVEGPFPADAFFGRLSTSRYDAIVAMYHDQGLIPLKMSARGTAVNVTAGLPIVRTSPDHGTAFDIAGKNKANPESMALAIELAVLLARNRTSNTRRQVQ